MKTAVVITVDTEPSIAGAFEDPTLHAPLIHEPVWGEVAGESHALGFLMRVLRRFEFEATFFVETVHTSFFDRAAMAEYVGRLSVARQDVQLHLHPMWLNFDNGVMRSNRSISDDCFDLDFESLTELMIDGCDTIEEWTGRRPSSLRTGNFSTSMAVYMAMQRAGLRTASNLCIAVRVPAEKALRVAGGVHTYSSIREFPVTCLADLGPVGRGAYRPFQITSLSTKEQIGALESVHAAGGSVVVVLTHPFEYLRWKNTGFEGMKPNRMVQRRFEKLCGYLDANRDRFEVIPMCRIAERFPDDEQAVNLTGSPIQSILRATANFFNDRIG